MRRDRPLKQRHYWLSDGATFTDANDHNPTIPEDCPRCGGSGRMHVSSRETRDGLVVHSDGSVTCDACGGTGTTGKMVPYFDNDAPVIEVMAGADGWLTCPCCGWRFTVQDGRVWSGLRHVRCGQRIRLSGRDA